MKNLAISFVFLLVFSFSTLAQSECVKNAKIVEPMIPSSTKNLYEKKLFEAKQDYKKSPNDADSIIWLGRRTAYLGKYKQSINIYTDGIAEHKKDARFYRHRGHRYISIRCFDDAIKDLKKAAKLTKGKRDKIEPDGLPNARNIPTSTLKSNIWYHLGLAYYLKKDFKKARTAYENCLRYSKNPDMLVATTNWLYVTLRRLDKTKEAEKVLKKIGDNLDIIENDSYYKLLKIYQGKIKAEDLLKEIGSDSNSLNNASVGYGLGNWFLINGETQKAKNIFGQITKGNQWSSFGFIAAEVERK